TWYKQGAVKGQLEGCYRLANYYIQGRAVQQDSAQAIYWYLKASEKHHINAQLIIAGFYETGGGNIKQDLTVAAQLYASIGSEYSKRFEERQQLLKQAKASGKAQLFSASHNFKAAFLPGYRKVVLHAAQGYENYGGALIYSEVDYRIIDLATMNFERINKAPYKWDTDYKADTRSERVCSDMVYMAAFAPGSAPDTILKEQLSVLRPVMKLKDDKYMKPEGKFINRLADGSLIYAVINRKWSSDKADIELYRRSSANSNTLEKYFTIPHITYPELSVFISDNGKRVLFYDHINKSQCPVYDVPSGKKIAKINMHEDYFYASNTIVKFTPGGDSVITSRREWPVINICNIRTGNIT
ncbi:MAG: sel1 repeat family protein, partial [Sphingobacteriales bacterium]